MAPLNKSINTYHCIQGMYWRNASGELLAVEGSNSKSLPEIWTQLKDIVCSSEASWNQLQLPSGKLIKSLPVNAAIPALLNIRSNFPPSYQQEELNTQVSEIEHENGLFLGILTSRPKSVKADGFGVWAERFILLETEFQPFADISSSSSTPWAVKHRETCTVIAEIFERRLKNVSKDDQWHLGGKEVFLNRVYGYVDKNLPIQLALPAFPCKSPNPNKVGGIMPDLAEHIAMDALNDFVKEVNSVYEPGATMWVINDGHVFSDCIGVDDEMIDTYDACMAAIYNERYPEDGPVPSIKFKGLKNIFAADSEGFQGLQKLLLNSHQMPHPVKTKLTGEAELCRKLMLGIGGPDRAYIRQLIEQQEPDALGLYRGQTRFMLEDLADIPSVKSMSGKQKKKTAALVAEEMMSRNQAYSNLTELLLPNYVRLSIHAHNNAGPKFAIRLLPANKVRAIDSLETCLEPNPVYEYQLPTPWHNCMIKVEGDEFMYLAKAQVARKALQSPDFEGSWVDGPDGSYFSLKRKSATTSGTTTTTTPPKLVIPSTITMEKVSVFNQNKKSTIVLVTPINEKKKPIIICSPVVGKNSPIVVTSSVDDGHRPIVVCSPVTRRQAIFSPIADRVRSPIGSPIVRTKTSVIACDPTAEKGATVAVSPIETGTLKRQDTHFVQQGEKNRLRKLMPVISMLRSIRSSA